jgi:hypothetical protein
MRFVEIPLALLVFAREKSLSVVISGADLLFFSCGDVAAGWKIEITRNGIALASGCGKTLTDAAVAALADARRSGDPDDSLFS